ncbi:division/cell wall cluster transcriptional repressor MraZ [Tropicimonas sp.]|uniref:division/cell wall cluster transcriptional repressor MraZ n=1 Tax=Tropicimonas sp. TaxID=2067044 RepID=UPI003A884B63
MDTKGRVSIPALFRRVLEANDEEDADPKCPSLVIHYGPAERQHFIECYTMAAAAEVDARIAALPRGSKERRFLESYFHGKSQQTTVDETGRLVLSKALRDLLGLTDEAKFVGSGDTFKIWNPGTYEAEVVANDEEMLDDLPEGADPLTMLEGGAF